MMPGGMGTVSLQHERVSRSATHLFPYEDLSAREFAICGAETAAHDGEEAIHKRRNTGAS